MKRYVPFGLSVVLSIPLFADSMSDQLQRWNEDPTGFYFSPPLHSTEAARPVGVDDRSKWLDGKTAVRKNVQSRSINSAPIRGNSPYATHDEAQGLLDDLSGFESNVFAMDAQGLRQGRIRNQPWSDTYWPIYKGVLGARYADPRFNFTRWPDFYRYIQANPVSSMMSNTDMLSPAEKYDLLVSRSGSYLTNGMWAEGKSYFDQTGKVETWMGVCHGWAPAAYMVERPLRKVTVPSADGQRQITFYPADIRGLTSLLWAKASVPTRFIGGRCGVKTPASSGSGRIQDRSCFDVNPGSWHMAVVNRIGRQKQSFVLDATYDYEVWNQPAIAYRYRYFNPETRVFFDKPQNATIDLARFASDPFRQFRTNTANKVVGVAMEFTYLVEKDPVQTDDGLAGRDDAKSTVTYLYDLELDSRGQILGGEWYQHAHPDFLWTPVAGAKPMAPGDVQINNDPLWDGTAPLPQTWKEVGKRAGANHVPSAKIVRSLLELSNK